jgi:rhamnosyl/mannosyltransferase
VLNPLLRNTLNSADTIIASNPKYIDSSGLLNLYKEKLTVIPYGVDHSQFATADEHKVKLIRQKYGSRIVLFVGKFRYYKGLEVLLESARSVDGKFLLIGDGPNREMLLKKIAEYGLNEKVFLLGELPDDEIVDYYQASDLFVLPSIKPSEAFGITLLEAMASKKPVISTELGTGTSFVNIHGKTGLVVAPNNPPELAKAISFLLENAAMRQTMGEEGLRRVSSEFTVEKMVDRVKGVYSSLYIHG